MRGHNTLLIWIGSLCILFMVVVAVAAPWLAPQDPNIMSLTDRYAAPLSGTPFWSG